MDSSAVKEKGAGSPNSGEKRGGIQYYLSIALPLLIITTVVAVLMAVVNGLTAAKIAKNEQDAMYSAIGKLYSDYDEISKLDVDTVSPVVGVYEVRKSGAVIGYAVNSKPAGFKDKIELMTGIAPTGEISGVEVVSMNETPGVGSKTNSDTFLSQFAGKSGTLAFGSGSGVDAVSGATISSRAVLSGINASVSAVEALIASGAGSAGTPAADTQTAETQAAESETTASETEANG